MIIIPHYGSESNTCFGQFLKKDGYFLNVIFAVFIKDFFAIPGNMKKKHKKRIMRYFGNFCVRFQGAVISLACRDAV